MAEHDYIIANGTGSAVRTDLNNALSAIASNNSKATDLTTNYAYQWYADTGDNTLKIRNAANDAYVNVSAVGGIGSVNLGLAALTGATFTGDVILDNQVDLRFEEATANGSNFIAFQAPAAITSDVTLTLPAVAPTANQVLKADASTPTTLTWAAESGGSSVGGDTGIDFNDDIAIRFGTGNDISLDFDSGTNAFNLVCSNAASILLDSDDDITIRSDDEIQFQTTGSTTQAFFSSAGLELVDDNHNLDSSGATTNKIIFHDTDTSAMNGQTIGRLEFHSSDSSSSGRVAYINGATRSTSGGGSMTFAASPSGSTTTATQMSISSDGVNIFTTLTGIGVGTAVCVLREVQAHATDGGTFTSGSDQVRVLNTEEHDGESFCTLNTSTGEFTLPAGTYLMYFHAPAHDVNSNRAKIVTDGGTDKIFGTNVSSDLSDPSTVISQGWGVVTNASEEGYFLKHRCASTKATSGFGLDCNFASEEEFYATVIIFRMD